MIARAAPKKSGPAVKIGRRSESEEEEKSSNGDSTRSLPLRHSTYPYGALRSPCPIRSNFLSSARALRRTARRTHKQMEPSGEPGGFRPPHREHRYADLDKRTRRAVSIPDPLGRNISSFSPSQTDLERPGQPDARSETALPNERLPRSSGTDWAERLRPGWVASGESDSNTRGTNGTLAAGPTSGGGRSFAEARRAPIEMIAKPEPGQRAPEVGQLLASESQSHGRLFERLPKGLPHSDPGFQPFFRGSEGFPEPLDLSLSVSRERRMCTRSWFSRLKRVCPGC